MMVATILICVMSSYWVMAFLWTLLYKSKSKIENPHLFSKLARDEISHGSSESSLASSFEEKRQEARMIDSRSDYTMKKNVAV